MKKQFITLISSLLAASATQAYWQPHGQLSWQIQFAGTFNPNINAQVFDVDLFDTPQSTIDLLHGQGKKVICYFSAGSSENWRPDFNRFPREVKGRNLSGWAGEKWLDIRRLDILMPIMSDRIALAKQKGCDAVDPDNIDGYTNRTGFKLSYNDQLTYNRALANAAHSQDLAIGLKNDLNQIPDLVNDFDFAINESCMVYNECSMVSPFVAVGKSVFHIEYQADISAICSVGNSYGFSSMKKNQNLDGWRESCL
ncbi:MAG: endo alpha-1,4 polygalactosaminidase [Moraxellaceae bacterium]|nr:endo alpha-1,4 polygalactosaminidase [Moraxellaceae bacterium]